MSLFGFAQAQILSVLEKVKEIKLLESNRDEVMKTLAGYEFKSGEEYHYDHFTTSDVDISVEYSEGNCEEFRVDGFEVPEWKAIQIEIEPANPIKLKNLKIDLSKFKKEKVYHDIADLYVYYNKELGIIFTVRKGEIEMIELIPPSKNYNLMCNKEKAKILTSTKSIFDRKLKDRIGTITCYSANVEKLNLSQTKIIANCDLPDSKGKKPCSQSYKIIDVSTVAVDPENDVLTYSYHITGGKIVGTGAKVIWDLTGVKLGTYTITAAVDDGCGFCGKSMTKTVIVKECPNCRQN